MYVGTVDVEATENKHKVQLLWLWAWLMWRDKEFGEWEIRAFDTDLV